MNYFTKVLNTSKDKPFIFLTLQLGIAIHQDRYSTRDIRYELERAQTK